MKKKVTMTIDADVFGRFKEYCSTNGMKVSSKVEVLMKATTPSESSRL